MKKITAEKLITICAAGLLLSSLSGCGHSAEASAAAEITPGAETSQTAGTVTGTDRLINHMTDTELSGTLETDFMLLDKPWEKASQLSSENAASISNNKIYLGDRYGAIVYGTPLFNALPSADYDGGAGEVVYYHTDISTGENTETLLSYSDYDDLKEKLREETETDIKNGHQRFLAEGDLNSIIALYDAVLDGSVQMINSDIIEDYMNYYYASKSGGNDESMYWEMDEDKVAAIKDNIHEYHLYDEELDLNFIVHVTTPPDYAKESAYPAIVLTDAVWRFKDVPSMYELMKEGKADPAILITIGFDYDTDGWDNSVRANILCDHKKEFLDFITDNMMPYLNTIYEMDFENSTLFGHSQGGVFTHYAAFNYDLYENRPFKNYIIGSPTFWTPYFTCVKDYDAYKNEYGYFERNTSYDRNLFITAGDKEDADYEEYYGENDSTLEGVKHLRERLDLCGVTAYEIRTYDSNHYMYVPEMLSEYIREHYSPFP
ncbi:MAG: hypothetical protein IKR23_01425 [Lachnospiraceae bacterium]|nr:hypothetical protein [Lachnospiraceae bacterium]